MGNFQSKKSFVVMNGLDCAGKTTIMYKLCDDDNKFVSWEDRNGWDFWSSRCEAYHYKNLTIVIWDSGGQKKIRPLFKEPFNRCKALIFVIDANDHERLYQVHDELHWILNEPEMKNKPVCIMLNKWDQMTNPFIMNQEDENGILHKIGMIQYHPLDVNILKSILDDLPMDILQIIAEYAVNTNIGPCEGKRVDVDELKENIGYELSLNIYEIICSYLPPYEYINKVDIKSKVFKTSTVSMQGVKDAMDWVCQMIKSRK